jgi:hypothetical protein
LKAIFLDEVRGVVSKNVMDSFSKSIEIQIASLGDDAGVMGAAALIAAKVEKGA